MKAGRTSGYLGAVADDRPSSPSSLQKLLLTVLGAVASGIGVIGFLIFVGGAVQVGRDRGVGLSAPFAVPLTPRSQLLTSGADQLFGPFVLTLAVVGVAAVYLAARNRLSERSDRWVRLLALLGGAATALIVFSHHAGDPTPAPFATGDNQTAFAAAILVLAFGVVIAHRLARPVARSQRIGDSPRLLGFLCVIAVTALTVVALETFAHSEWMPQMRPLALLGPTYPSGLTGVYVGEDSSNVYVGVIDQPLSNIESKRLRARVLTVKRSEITALSVGGLFSLTNYQSPRTPGQAAMEERDERQLMRAETALLQELRVTHA
jgi:hypothetical protein